MSNAQSAGGGIAAEFQSIESKIEGVASTVSADLVKFAAEVQSGAQIVAAKFDQGLKLLVAHIGEIDQVVQAINAHVPQVLQAAQTAGATPGELETLQKAVGDANDLLAGLNGAAAAASNGGGDVSALLNGIGAAAAASKSASSVVQALALLQSPVAAQVVSPPSPPAD